MQEPLSEVWGINYTKTLVPVPGNRGPTRMFYPKPLIPEQIGHPSTSMCSGKTFLAA